MNDLRPIAIAILFSFYFLVLIVNGAWLLTISQDSYVTKDTIDTAQALIMLGGSGVTCLVAYTFCVHTCVKKDQKLAAFPWWLAFLIVGLASAAIVYQIRLLNLLSESVSKGDSISDTSLTNITYAGIGCSALAIIATLGIMAAKYFKSYQKSERAKAEELKQQKKREHNEKLKKEREESVKEQAEIRKLQARKDEVTARKRRKHELEKLSRESESDFETVPVHSELAGPTFGIPSSRYFGTSSYPSGLGMGRSYSGGTSEGDSEPEV